MPSRHGINTDSARVRRLDPYNRRPGAGSTTLTLLRHEERERHDGKRKTDPRRKRPPSLRVRPTA